MTRRIFTIVAGIVIVSGAALNLWRAVGNAAGLSHNSDDLISWENHLRGIRGELVAAHYRTGSIGYMPLEVLRGHKRTEREDVNWVEVRWVLIPFKVLQDSLDAPYVILDSTGSHGAPEVPAGFASYYEDGSLILLQRNPQ